MATRQLDIPTSILDSDITSETGAPRPEQERLRGGPYKVDKQTALYRDDDPIGSYQCNNCAAFIKPKKCLILTSRVTAVGHCDQWRPSPGGTTRPTDEPLFRRNVNYQEHEDGVSCDDCVRFNAPDQCSYVLGDVTANGSCKAFKRKQAQPRLGLGSLTSTLATELPLTSRPQT